MPAVVLGALALALDGRVPPSLAAGAIAIALAPAPLVGPAVVGRLGGRADLGGALVLGTALLCVALAANRALLAPAVLLAAVEAFAVAALVANALPTIRDALLVPLRLAGAAAFAAILALAVMALPTLDAATVAVAAAFVLCGAGAAALVARLQQRDVRAAVACAGLRDPALACALVYLGVGPDALGVPLAYAAMLALGAVIAWRA